MYGVPWGPVAIQTKVSCFNFALLHINPKLVFIGDGSKISRFAKSLNFF